MSFFIFSLFSIPPSPPLPTCPPVSTPPYRPRPSQGFFLLKVVFPASVARSGSDWVSAKTPETIVFKLTRVSVSLFRLDNFHLDNSDMVKLLQLGPSTLLLVFLLGSLL